jgi:hypothetical protein
MKISELPRYLQLLPPTQSVLIIGPPGCGKSTAVREFAESEAQRLGREFIDYDDDDELFLRITKNPEKYYIFIDLRLTETEPTDFLGVPRDIDHFIVYKPLRWVQVFSHPSATGIVFLDEITNVRREDVLAQAYKLVLDRRAGFKSFSPGVRVIAAGNHPETSAVANLLPAPLTNRFSVIDIDSGDIYEWIEYVNTREGGIDPRVAGYITRFPGDLYHKADAETLENFPTRRAWSRLNQVIRDNNITDLSMVEELAKMKVGKVVAAKFAAFCRLQKYLPTPDKILKNPDVVLNKEVREEEFSRIDLIYYAVATVASYLLSNKADEKEVINFSTKLANVQGDLLVVFIRLLPKNMRSSMVLKLSGVPEIQKTIQSIAKYI